MKATGKAEEYGEEYAARLIEQGRAVAAPEAETPVEEAPEAEAPAQPRKKKG